MRSVYTFSRPPADTIAALSRVFNDGPAREQLSLHAEMLVEPIGWDALWKLSKELCKKFDVRFPCVAYITVTSVDFERLSACVEVQSVQHETVSLPESLQDVPLVDLWPTLKQKEECVDAATTAEFIDLMRFFYNTIWMPWDDQDDKVLLLSTIEERMQLWTDVQNGTIPKTMAREITLLRNSAIDAYDRLKVLYLSLCEGDDNDEDDSLLPSNYIALCAELTAKLGVIQAKWLLYEKARIRQQYVAREKAKADKNKGHKKIVAIWQGGSASEFSQLSTQLQARLSGQHKLILTPTTEQAFALDPEELVVCSPLCEVPEMPLEKIIISSLNGATLKSSDMRSCLLQLTGDCTLRGLTLQCATVNTVVVTRAGKTHIQHCNLLDESPSSQSDFAQGIVVMADSTILIEDTTFQNFYCGIVVHKGAHVELKNCTIRECSVGVHMHVGARVTLSHTTITRCAATEHCVRVEGLPGTSGSAGGGAGGGAGAGAGGGNTIDGLHIAPNCTIGSGDLHKEILVVTQDID